ncbi:MAG: hypothetical protein GX056_03845 [Synergistaceae bacterium]|jgi:hypothetical protein|nr:hypothetical protein [Synergistaceae bacterium]
MIYLIAIWLLQDFVQVFLMGFFIVPNIYLMLLLMISLLPATRKEKQIILIWAAFAGGLIWDFRWTNLPGMTAALNAGLVAAACFLWYKIPAQGRTVVFFTFILIASILISGFAHFALWTVPSQVALRQFFVQQLLGVPLVIVFSLIYWKVSDRNV